MGIGRRARAIPACTAASRLRDAARPCAQLRRSVQSTITGRVTAYTVVDLRDLLGGLRLAALGNERVEGRARPARRSAPRRSDRPTRGSTAAAQVRGVRKDAQAASRSTTGSPTRGPRCRKATGEANGAQRCDRFTFNLQSVEVARRLRDRFLARLLERFLETASRARRRGPCSVVRTTSGRAPRDCAACSARMRCASSSSGRSADGGSLWRMTRCRLASTTSVAEQHGQATSNSDFSLGIGYLSFHAQRAAARSSRPSRATTGSAAASVARTSTRSDVFARGVEALPRPVTKFGERRLEGVRRARRVGDTPR